MSEENWKIVASVTGVFLVIGLGAFSRRIHWLSREADQSLTRLTANVLMPAFFLTRILEGEHIDSLLIAWIPPAIGFVTTTLGLLIAWQFARSFGKYFGLETDGKQRSFALCTGICNYGYIPLPLARVFYPAAEVDLILHNVGVDLALWSIGIIIISGGLTENTKSAPNGPRQAKANPWRRALLNPPLVAVIIAVVIRQTNTTQWVPAPVLSSISLLSVCAIPIGLLLSGAIIIDFMGQADLRGAWRTVTAAILLRQLAIPILILAAATLLPLAITVKQVMLLQASMSSAIFPIVLVRMYDRDTATALRSVLSTSIAGIVLIPVWLSAGKWWLGL